MIAGAHQLGFDGDMTVRGRDSNASAALMTVEITNYGGAGEEVVTLEWLGRSDVERLRDLCEGALS